MDGTIEFGAFRLENEVVYSGAQRQIALPEQAIKVLRVFLEHALRQGGQPINSEKIRLQAWQGRTVDHNNLHQQIIRLRRELGADVILSVKGPRGYQFNLPVRLAGQPLAVAWRAISILPFVCAPGFFRDEARLRLAGYHMALGVIDQLRLTTSLEIREISSEFLQPSWQPDVKQTGQTQRSDLVLSGFLTAPTQAGQADELRAQLTEAATGNVLWAGRFKTPANDLAVIEQAIARQIAEHLGFPSSAVAAPRAVKQYHPEAVARYRKGRYLYFHGHQIIKEALDEFTYAVSLDPTYPEPWVGIADIWVLRCTFGLTEFATNEAMPKGLAAVTRALELDPLCGTAHYTRGTIAYLWEWNWEIAERHFRQAIQLEPDYLPAYNLYARMLCARGRFDEAMAQTERGLAVGPHVVYSIAMSAWVCCFAGEHERALELCRDTIAKAPGFPLTWAIQGIVQDAIDELGAAAESLQTAINLGENLVSLSTLGLVYGRMGRKAEAEQVLAEFAARQQQHYVSPYHAALVQAGLGNRAAALAQLQACINDRSEWISHLPADHRLRSLHSEPQFDALLAQAGLRRLAAN